MYPPLTQDELQHLPDVISAPRFATYLQARANNRERALALYRWNLEISAAFMGPLHICEVAVRNAISEAIENVHSGAWPWTKGFIRSLPAPGTGYNPNRDLGTCSNKHATTGKVVADLKFAFWEKMLTKRFDKIIWASQFSRSFPGAPNHAGYENDRKTCRADMEAIRLFRNRIAHHEPVFARNLQADLHRILRLVEWRNPTASKWLAGFEPVSALIGAQP